MTKESGPEDKRKWRPDEFERVFCPLLRTFNKHRTRKQSLYWVEYLCSCDDIENTQFNTRQFLLACLTEHQPHRHSTVLLTTLQFIIFSLTVPNRLISLVIQLITTTEANFLIFFSLFPSTVTTSRVRSRKPVHTFRISKLSFPSVSGSYRQALFTTLRITKEI